MGKFYLTKTKIFQVFGTLQGLIDGIAADNVIKPSEIKALRTWLDDNSQLSCRPPFSETMKVIKNALADNYISECELKDIRFVCENTLKALAPLAKNKTNSIQKLHGIASGIASDRELHPKEWNFLSDWIKKNHSLKGSWPYDEIEALTVKHNKTENLIAEEKEIIIHYLNDFCGFNSNASLTHPLNEPNKPITGICAVCPEVEFKDKVFCLTGESSKYSRKEFAKIIFDLGGIFKDDVSQLVDYLIVCAEGSPMWTYSCYGRKVEDAINLRKSGHRIFIVHEFDFLDSVKDAA